MLKIILFLFSCSSNIENIELNNSNFSISDDIKFDGIQVFPIGHSIPENYKIIDELFIGPYGSNSCDYESVLYQIEEQTKERGGDGFKIIDVKYPTALNPCYMITAFILEKK